MGVFQILFLVVTLAVPGYFLTRTTTILATVFVVLSIALAALATVNRAPTELDDSLARQPGAVPTMPAPAPGAVPLGGGATDLAPIPAPVTAAPISSAPAAAPTVERDRPQQREATRREASPAERPAMRPTVSEKAAVPAAAPSIPLPAAPKADPTGGNGTQ